MKELMFIFKSIGLGFALYGMSGFLCAALLVYIYHSDHPHSMEELLYIFIVPPSALVGVLLGLILVSIKDCSMPWVAKYLCIGLPIWILFLLFFLRSF